MTIRVQRRHTGRVRDGECVLRRAGWSSPRCVRYVTVKGSLTAKGRAGDNRLRFAGRLGDRRLRPGRYRLAVTATDAAGNRSVVRRVRFRILP